jgi:CubicO group peptidase (beta-lactamase class C family)
VRILRPYATVWTALAGCGALLSSSGAAAQGLAFALKQLDPLVAETLAKTHVPGAAVAVVYQDRVVYMKCFGVRRLGASEPVDADTVFELASFSKPMASTVVAEEVGRGLLSWDTRIAELDPQFQLSDPVATREVTVRDLFSHRSGLSEESGNTLESLGDTRPHILHQLRYVALTAPLRKKYQYSNYGITEGALAAVRPLQLSWEEAADKLLYRRLGMNATSSRFSDYMNRPDRAALHYLQSDGSFVARYVRDADAESPAGGVSSSVRDLAQWVRLQLAQGKWNGQQVVARAALEETHKPVICQNVDAAGKCSNELYYGLGWDVSLKPDHSPRISHSGAFLMGTATTVYLLPEKQIGIIVLTNATPVGAPENIALTFLDDFEFGAPKLQYFDLLHDFFQQLRQTWVANSTDYSRTPAPSRPAAPAALASYVGSYHNLYYGDVQIELQQGRLVMRLPPRGAYYELSHWQANTFTYYTAEESWGEGRRGVRFEGGALELEVLKNLEYSNRFTRGN